MTLMEHVALRALDSLKILRECGANLTVNIMENSWESWCMRMHWVPGLPSDGLGMRLGTTMTVCNMEYYYNKGSELYTYILSSIRDPMKLPAVWMSLLQGVPLRDVSLYHYNTKNTYLPLLSALQVLSQ